VDLHFNRSSTVDKHGSDGKAKVIGLYGIPGSGKTFLLHHLKQELDEELFLLYEGSEVIAALTPGGLEAFQKSDEEDKTHWRKLAIDNIREECTNSGKVGIVTGHCMFWPETEDEGCMVYTENDLATYTHILYLDVPIQVIEQRRRDDRGKTRSYSSAAHLGKWQKTEKAQLRSLCREHGILFSLLASDSRLPSKLSALIKDFSLHSEDYNVSQAQAKLDEAVVSYQGPLETVLVLDADRTLAAEDTGALFWKRIYDSQQGKTSEENPLKCLFSGPLGYSYQAFRQAMLLYEEVVDDQAYETICQHVASAVTIHPEFVSLLQLVAQQEHIGAVVVSCGLRRVWEQVLEREGLSKTVRLIAGGRIADGLVVTAAVKAAVVTRLQELHHVYVWAFGDSPLDLDMLMAADQAVVVVGDKLTRSHTMDAALSNAMEQDGLRAIQVTLPSSALPRLDITKLPVADLTGISVIGDLLRRRHRSPGFSIYVATSRSAAKLLATPMRDAAVAGPALRKAHRQVGWYLACEFLTRIIGTEDCPISHVLGHETTGSRLLNEQQTTIVAVMRAGEPMASGVNEAFPLAMYVHARRSSDLKLHYVQGRSQIVLVDSVMNSGKTVVEFVQTIRKLDANICIVVVAGVVQAQCLSPSSMAYKTLSSCGNVNLVALRLSTTKFTGSGTTDTGNRLFNTTHLP
jgi:uracil phosphoribosyltransferase/phosphoserine phosphatase/adenylate kinase